MITSLPPIRSQVLERTGQFIRPWADWFSRVYSAIGRAELVEITFLAPLNANLVDQVIFIANSQYIVEQVSVIYRVAGTYAPFPPDPPGTEPHYIYVNLLKLTGTQDPTSPAEGGLLGGGFGVNLQLDINTVYDGELTQKDTAKRLLAGDRLSVDFQGSGTTADVAGLAMTVTLRAL